MFNKKVKLLSAILLLIVSFSAFAQEEDGEWYWEKPIAEITFDGLKTVKKSELNGVVSSFIDKPFNEETYNELLDRLYALDFFDDVEPYAMPAKKSGEVLLTFHVVEKPVIASINFSGNKEIRNGELREKINSKSSDIYVESKILMDERLLRENYIQKGYMNATVTHKIEETPAGIKVTFLIKEGAHVVITKISMQGNTIVSERTLKNKMTLKESGLFKDGAYQKSTLEADKQKILAYYGERGYIDAAFIDVVLSTEFNEAKNRDELSIDFIIQEGSQYVFNGVTFTGNEVFSDEKLQSYIKLKKGDVFNMTKFQEQMMALSNLYYENGYMSLESAMVPEKDTDRHELGYKIHLVEHTRSHIENVIIKGNSRTKEYVIRREIPVEPGDVFSSDSIMNGYRNIYNLQYFSSVMPEYQSGSEENLVDLVFNVEEQSTTSFQFGLTFQGNGLAASNSSVALPFSLYGKLENSNLFGEGRSISAGTNLSPTEQSIDLTYGQNWIGSLPISYSQSLSFRHSSSSVLRLDISPDGELETDYHYLNYEGWSASLGTSFGKRWTPNYAILSVAAGLTNTLTNYQYDEGNFIPLDSGVALYANRWGLTNSIWTSFSVDNRDINYDPTKGWFASERLSWYGFIPNVESEFFLKSDTKLEGYLKLCDFPVTEKFNLKIVLAAYTGFTNIFQFSDFFSDSSKCYVDGMFNGRGWTGIYNSAKGKSMLSNILELRVPLVPGYIGLTGFFDAVAVKPDLQAMCNSLSMNDFYFSFGPGLKFLMPQFPLHLLFAWKFRVQDGVASFDKVPFQFVLSFNLVNR